MKKEMKTKNSANKDCSAKTKNTTKDCSAKNSIKNKCGCGEPGCECEKKSRRK